MFSDYMTENYFFLINVFQPHKKLCNGSNDIILIIFWNAPFFDTEQSIISTSTYHEQVSIKQCLKLRRRDTQLQKLHSPPMAAALNSKSGGLLVYSTSSVPLIKAFTP